MTMIASRNIRVKVTINKNASGDQIRERKPAQNEEPKLARIEPIPLRPATKTTRPKINL